jgi:hypothetical protein
MLVKIGCSVGMEEAEIASVKLTSGALDFALAGVSIGYFSTLPSSFGRTYCSMTQVSRHGIDGCPLLEHRLLQSRDIWSSC